MAVPKRTCMAICAVTGMFFDRGQHHGSGHDNGKGDREGNSFRNARRKDTKNKEPFGWLSSDAHYWL